jgi:hypothetical protein
MENLNNRYRKLMIDEGIILEDLKKVLCSLNDIRVLLSSTFTRDYILECLR